MFFPSNSLAISFILHEWVKEALSAVERSLHTQKSKVVSLTVRPVMTTGLGLVGLFGLLSDTESVNGTRTTLDQDHNLPQIAFQL